MHAVTSETHVRQLGEPIKLKILFLSPIWGILNPTPAFGALWERPQHIASILAKNGHRILYVQGPMYVHPTTLPRIINGGNLFLTRKITAQLSAVNLYLPPFEDSSLRFVSDILGVSTLKLILKRLRFNPDVAVIYNIQYTHFSDALKSMGTKIVYDCVDEASGFSFVRDIAAIMKEERKLVSNSSIVITTSEVLRQRLSKLNSNCFYIPNAADVARFTNTAKTHERIPEMELLRHPIVAYVGAISDWFDVDLVCRLAELHPEYSILLVGPVRYGLEKFKQNPNIILLGPKKYEVIPEYLSYMDVCLIPFKINKLTLAANPIKMYEYLAAGKPVVSTALPEICNNASEFVYIGKNEEDFIRKVEEAVEEPKKPHYEAVVARRVRFAEDNSWEKRVDAFERLLRKTLQSH
jgi:hypothetical protein